MRWWPLAALGLAPFGGLSAQAPFGACVDRLGQPVRNAELPDATYPAMAGVDADGNPVIWWNRSRLGQLSESGQVYVYLHECGHVMLRHAYAVSTSIEARRAKEREADCWAAQLLSESGIMRGHHFEALGREWRNSVGDATHLGGKALLAWWDECAKAKTSARRWRPVLDSLLLASRDSFAGITGPLIREAGAEQAREATLDPPSTYDCEITSTRAYVCLLFASREMGSAENRQEKLERIFREWMGGAWTISEREAAEGTVARQFLAEHVETGTIFLLVLSRPGRIRLLARPATRGPGTGTVSPP